MARRGSLAIALASSFSRSAFVSWPEGSTSGASTRRPAASAASVVSPTAATQSATFFSRPSTCDLTSAISFLSAATSFFADSRPVWAFLRFVCAAAMAASDLASAASARLSSASSAARVFLSSATCLRCSSPSLIAFATALLRPSICASSAATRAASDARVPSLPERSSASSSSWAWSDSIWARLAFWDSVTFTLSAERTVRTIAMRRLAVARRASSLSPFTLATSLSSWEPVTDTRTPGPSRTGAGVFAPVRAVCGSVWTAVCTGVWEAGNWMAGVGMALLVVSG